MKNIYFLLLSIFLLSTPQASSQSCDCTFDEIENNQVTPLDTLHGTVINVSTTEELRSAINQVNNMGGDATILLADGVYPVASTSWYPYITASNLIIRSASGNRDAVVISGQGMQDVAPGTEIGLSLVGDNIIVSDLTISLVGNHAISTNSDNHIIHNVKIQDTFEQMIKGTSGGGGSHDCLVQCSLFEYTAGIGPQFYIGGLDIHEGIEWTVRNNLFKDIASPSGSLAEHAVHFWDNSADNIVERNWIINCDRGVGFGLGSSRNDRGIIRNNIIYNNGQDPFHDVGIGIETSPGTQIYHNTVHIEYQNAIEYRFFATMDVTITNNLTNKDIRSRNGASASLFNNFEEADAAWFLDAAEGNLRLNNTYPSIVDAGSNSVADDVFDDIDKNPRPQGDGYDIGAHEWIPIVDNDMDGFANNVDCDDENPDINPDAVEIPNNDVDEDCDGEALVIDNDMDGFNSDEDCDDENPDINPDAEEIVNNDVDENCDGEALVIDNDMDGFNSDEDCDDENPDINPDAEEIANNDVDEDCDGEALVIDNDMDGFNSDEDCDDENPDINPDAEEIANNGIDEDCDGEDLVTSIENIKEIDLEIYPNPTEAIITIAYDGDIQSIGLYDINFKLVKIEKQSNMLDLSALPNGIYTTQIQLEEGEIIYRKIVKR